MKTFAIATIALTSFAEAKLGWGGCPPNLTYIEDFKPAQYAGKWYEIQRDKMMPYELGADCIT